MEFVVGLHRNDVWSVNYFTKKMKELAVRCNFDNPLRCTGQGNRHNGISRMVNSSDSIPIRESMMASRHKSIESHMIYERPDEEAHAKRYRALMAVTDVDKENILPQDKISIDNKDESKR